MPRILVAKKGNSEVKVLLDQERLIVGRDKQCDVYLDDAEVSRRHAAIIYKFGCVYVENISSTGQILRGNDPVEYCELNANDELKIGSFSIFWKDDVNPVLNTPTQSASLQAPQEPLQADILMASVPHLSAEVASDAPLAEGEIEKPSDLVQQNDFNLASAEPNAADSSGPAAESPPADDAFNIESPPDAGADFLLDNPPQDAGVDAALSPPVPNGSENYPTLNNNVPNVDQGDDAGGNYPVPSQGSNVSSIAFTSNGETRVSNQELGATLRILSGEVEGREIKLGSDQNEWIIGRGSKCDIPIDNAKLSRTHCKLIREGKTFKVLDLDSGAGTRVNGVSVKDSKLNSFDTLKIGPVEIQFIIADNKVLEGAGPLKLLMNDSGPGQLGSNDPAEIQLEGGRATSSGEKTAFAAPVPYSPQGFQGARTGNTNFSQAFAIPNPNYSSPGMMSGNNRIEASEGPFGKVKEWFGELNGRQKAIYVSLAALLVFSIVWVATGMNEAAVAPAATPKLDRQTASTGPAETPSTSTTSQNAAVSGDVDPAFYKLSAEKRAQIEELYAKAERAYQEKDWNEAYKNSNEVLKLVESFKKAKDILYESQMVKSNNMIGTISTTLNKVDDAAKENNEKIEMLVEAGEKALSEKRWDDAVENFSRAVTLDPNNARAAQGYTRALKKDLTAVAENLPNAPVQADPAEQEREELNQEFQELRRVLNNAHEKVRAGNFGEALKTLKQLEYTVRERQSNYTTGRAPASVREQGTALSNKMLLNVREIMDQAKSQLEAEYQTQLVDADSFVANKQYVQAKEIYNKILKVEPEFDKAKADQAKLWAKIISEAREKYQEALVHENVGDIDQALEEFEQTRDLLLDVDNTIAADYYKKSLLKIRRLKR